MTGPFVYGQEGTLYFSLPCRGSVFKNHTSPPQRWGAPA